MPLSCLAFYDKETASMVAHDIFAADGGEDGGSGSAEFTNPGWRHALFDQQA
jgi:hypothetical protein